MNLKKIYSMFIGVAAISLVGCGGGGGGDNPGDGSGSGYTGSTAPASITGNNAEGVGQDSTEAVRQAIDTNSAGGSVPFGISITDTSALAQVQAINGHVLNILQNANLPIGIVLDGSSFPEESGYCGGTVTVPDNFLDGGTTGTITYNNLCLDLGGVYGAMTVNGTITVGANGATSYANFSVAFENGTSFSCNNVGCSTSTVYSDSNGTSYQITDASVSGDGSSGFSVNATYCQSSYGCLTIQTDNPILFDCSNAAPSSGSISFSSTNGSSGTITFNSCSSYTITYTLSAGGAVNTISGTW